MEYGLHVIGIFFIGFFIGFERVDAFGAFFDAFEKFLRRGTIADVPIVLGSIIVQYHCGGRGTDVESFVDLVSYFFSSHGMEKNKILVKKLLEFFVLVELLIQQ
jgi:hypothetical protein